MIILKNVTKRYGTHNVLNSVSVRYSEGKTHVIIGSSGCGKSTLLRAILGLIPYDSGVITTNNIPVSPQTQKLMALNIGYVIQEGGLFPHLTAEKNITLITKTSGLSSRSGFQMDMSRFEAWTPRKISDRLHELRELVRLDESTLKRYPQELSGGQRQRVGLIRALMINPPILVLDEPLGALDPIVRVDLQKELKRIFNTLKKTVLIVTHDIGEAAYFGDTVTLMRTGKVVQHGTFEDLVRRPKSPFVSEFITAQRPPDQLREAV